MSRLRNLIFLSCLLVAFEGCESEEGGDLSGGNTQPANSTAPRPSAAAARLPDQESALMLAAAKGDTKTVKDLLDKGVKVDTRDPDGNATALCHAAWFGHAETAQLLIERGADVNAKKSDGTSVLTLAAARNHKDLVDMLKKAGAQ